jgi:ribose transport system permease protein
VVGVWIAMIAVFSAAEPGKFFTGSVFQAIFDSQENLVFLTMALLCTIIVGEFVDLSVPSVFGFAATILPVLAVNHGWNVWEASLAAVLGAILVGALNGYLVVYVGVNTIVVTLGMSTLLLGISLWMSNMNTISGLPNSFSDIALTQIGGLPISFYYGVVIVAGFAYVLGCTPLGRHMRFVGANREVSRLSGIRVNRVRFGSFVAAGAFSGVGAVVYVAEIGSFNATTSASLLLPVFASVFLGTAIVDPGRFNPIGTFIGIYFLATGSLGLQLLNLENWVSDVFYGGVLVIAVTISTLLGKRAS